MSTSTNVSTSIIPPPFAGMPKWSRYRKLLEETPPGKCLSFKSHREQAACYACGKRMGLGIVKRKFGDDHRVYVVSNVVSTGKEV